MISGSKLKAELDTIWWSLFANYVDIWSAQNPNASVDDLLKQVKEQAASYAANAVEEEIAGGVTKEQAEYIVRNLASHRAAAAELLS